MSLISSLSCHFLKNKALRRRLTFEIKQHCYNDLDLSVPVGSNCRAPILHPDYWRSFEEIFSEDEYGMVGDKVPVPQKWLDLGCHAGFFSLFALRANRRANAAQQCDALLVDGDQRIENQIRRLIAINDARGFQFEHGAISDQLGSTLFVQRNAMISSAGDLPWDGFDGITRKVPVLTPNRILELLPPPYDLIKVDIEGAEYEFLTAYQAIISRTSLLLLEWHSWHTGKGGLPQILDVAKTLGFTRQQAIQNSHHRHDNESGMLLLRREL